MQSSDNTQIDTQSYRMALRRFHCYECDHQFGTMIDLNRNNDVNCSACGSDFVEEMKSIERNPIQQERVEEAPESPVIPIPTQQQAQQQPQLQRHLPVQQQRVVTQQFGSDGQGFTRSVTISYGTGMSEPQVTTSNFGLEPTVNIGNMNNINMNFG